LAVTDRSLYFEDCRVGQRFESGPRHVSAADLETFTELSGDRSAIHVDDEAARVAGFPAKLMHGPDGVAVVFGLLHELGIVEHSVIAMFDLDWRFPKPILPGDDLTLRVLLTRCRATSREGVGVVGRHLSLWNQREECVQEGSSTILVAARDASAMPLEAHRLTDFAAVPWAEELARRLGEDETFTAATQTFDGAIGLGAGRDRVQLRVYRGAVVDIARTTPKGPTFSVNGTELAWTELATASRNDYVSRAMHGKFEASGDMYEYVRMTKATVALWDTVRAMAAEAGS
jgi:acyl dehydratase